MTDDRQEPTDGEPGGTEATLRVQQLFVRHQGIVKAFILSLQPGFADAEDVLQEVNLVIWRRADEYQHGTDFGAWVFKIASFQIMALRQKLVRDRLQFSDELLAQIANNEFPSIRAIDLRREALQHCLEKLEKGELELVRLRYECGDDVASLAGMLGRSAKAIYRSLAKIHGLLMNCVQHRLATEDMT